MCVFNNNSCIFAPLIPTHCESDNPGSVEMPKANLKAINKWRVRACFRAWLSRLFHKPILVTIALQVGYEKWPPVGWHHPFVTAWSKYGLGLPQSKWIVGSRGCWGCTSFFRVQWESLYLLCTALTAGERLPLGLCKETVKESSKALCRQLTPNIRSAWRLHIQHAIQLVPL